MVGTGLYIPEGVLVVHWQGDLVSMLELIFDLGQAICFIAKYEDDLCLSVAGELDVK